MKSKGKSRKGEGEGQEEEKEKGKITRKWTKKGKNRRKEREGPEELPEGRERQKREEERIKKMNKEGDWRKKGKGIRMGGGNTCGINLDILSLCFHVSSSFLPITHCSPPSGRTECQMENVQGNVVWWMASSAKKTNKCVAFAYFSLSHFPLPQ